MKPSLMRLGSFLAVSLSLGCVARDKYDAALNDATRARADLEAHRKLAREAHSEGRAELGELRRELVETQFMLGAAQREIEFAGGIALTCGEALDESTTLNEGLESELDRLGKDVGVLAATKDELAGSLERARAGLEELRGAQTAANAQAALFRDLATRLRRMLDAGQLEIVLRSGRMVLVLPADILFEPGKATIGSQGRDALAELGRALAAFEGRRFQVAGHTDADPIRFSRFASNWQLSTARALEVVDALIQVGVPGTALSAAGYAEFDPVSANDAPASKAKNRRIEIVLQPNIDQLVEVPR